VAHVARFRQGRRETDHNTAQSQSHPTLVGVEPHDPLVFAAAPVVLLRPEDIPARRASRVGPLAALRND